MIQVNTDLPIYINRAIHPPCHEGCRGHHTCNTLIEKNLVSGEGWIESSLRSLFSSQSLYRPRQRE